MSKQPPARCSLCDSEELLTVTLAPHGDAIAFTICNACGWKAWGRGDERVVLSVVRPLLGRQPPEQDPSPRTTGRASQRSSRGSGVARRSRSRASRRGRSNGRGDAA